MSKLKYPVLLVHGMGFRDSKRICYWGRIPKMMEDLDCEVFYGNQDSNADIETNGKHIANRIEEIISLTGADKVNIIAHSKGGLDCRYAISTEKFSSKVASLTTISTPHRGSKTVDWFMRIPKPLIKFGAFCADCWFRLIGDKKPNTYKVICSFTTDAAEKFNRETPNCEFVYYQSFAVVMKKPSSDLFLWLSNIIVNKIEGENDGLVTPHSAEWGNFKGVYRGVGKRGISHCDEVDMRRRPISNKSGEGVSDIVDVYKDIIDELAELGY